ncbi:N-6 DNA methylase [Escherichia albertii]
MTKKSALGQYYTPSSIAAFIVDNALKIIKKKPRRTLELAAGEGHLLMALEKVAADCKMYAIDIDSTNSSSLKLQHKNYVTFNADATKPLDFLKPHSFDFAIGNPPFLNNVIVDHYIQHLLSDILNMHVKLGSRIRAEYVFTCQYLYYLDTKGVLAIIMPESVISGVRSATFRESLIKKYKIEQVIELEESSFSTTEAKTHVIFIRNEKPDNAKIKLSSLKNAKMPIFVNSSSLIERMDYTFHSLTIKQNKKRKLTNHALIERGKLTHSSLKITDNEFIHSTTFNHDFNNNTSAVDDSLVRNGDLIMCRVGSRVAGKIREYKGSPVRFSDCIYKIRFSDDSTKREFLSFINSENGKKIITSLLRGVCSKYITKKDLEMIHF